MLSCTIGYGPLVSSTAYTASTKINPIILYVLSSSNSIQVQQLLHIQKMLGSKPSDEATSPLYDTSNGIIIGDITFATAEELQSSIKEASKKTEVYTISERLHHIEKMMTLPKLTSSN